MIIADPAVSLIQNPVDAIVCNDGRGDEGADRRYPTQAELECIACRFGFLKHGLFSSVNFPIAVSRHAGSESAYILWAAGETITNEKNSALG